jgi:nucleoside-diphosphate-sugar epimerase
VPAWPIWVAAAVTELAYAPFGASPPIYRRRVEFFTRSRAFDIARARAELGYEPKVRLLDGIRRTFEWYRAYRWL